MEYKLKPIVQTILLGSLMLMPSFGYAGNKELDQYIDYLEPEDNVIITEKIETITYSQAPMGVSAKHTVKTNYMNRRYGENCSFQIYYDEETSKITNIKEERVTHSFSSNLDNDVIFFDGLNICNCETNLHQVGEKATFEYDKIYSDAVHLPKVVFAEPRFIGKHTITIEVPSWLEMEIKEYCFNDSVKKTVTQDRKKTIYTYTLNNVKPIKEERFSKSHLKTFPSIVFAYKHVTLPEKGKLTLFATIQDQYLWYNNLLRQSNDKDDNLANLCAETKKIVAGCKDDYEKVAAIYQWVQKNIRYIAIENGIEGFKPQVASKVMDNKYGDCKGMANLLRSMLKCEGIDGRMVWLGTNDLPYDYSIPSLAVDNHAICAAILKTDTIYLDATCEYAAMKEYPSSIAGRPVLLENGYKGLLTHVPNIRPHDNLDSIHISMKITEKGLEGTFKNILKGEDKITFLSYFDDDFSDVVESLRKKRYKGVPVENDQVKITGILPSSPQTVVEYPFVMTEPFTKTDKKYYISMDIKHTLMSLVTQKRETDFEFLYKAVDVYTCELEIPSGYKVTYLPQNLSIDKERYKFEITYKQKGNTLTYFRSITLKETNIPVKEFDEWGKDLEQLKSAYMEMVTLGK